MKEYTKNNGDIKRLFLSTDDKKIAGVCGGIAEYFEVDVTVVRLTWVIITLITGIIPGFIAYLLAAFIMPRQRIPIVHQTDANHD